METTTAPAGTVALRSADAPVGNTVCREWAVHSQVAGALAWRTAAQAAALDAAADRMTAVAQLEWVSPAGRLCADHIRSVAAGARITADELRTAAVLVDSYAQVLRSIEYSLHTLR